MYSSIAANNRRMLIQAFTSLKIYSIGSLFSLINHASIMAMAFSTGNLQLRCKPPNVLIYCKPSEFVQIKKTLLTIINPDRYAVYHLEDSKIDTTPWADNTELLVIKANKLTAKIAKTFLSFHRNGGNLFSFHSSFCHYYLFNFINDDEEKIDLIEVVFKHWKVKLLCPNLLKPLIVGPEKKLSTIATNFCNQVPVIWANSEPSAAGLESTEGKAALSLVDLEYDPDRNLVNPEWTSELKENDWARLNILREIFSTNLGMDCTQIMDLSPTPCYVFAGQRDKDILMRRLKQKINNNEMTAGRNLTLFFCKSDIFPAPAVTEERLPVIMDLDWANSYQHFHPVEFADNLDTHVMGKIVFYCEVLSTTMAIANGLSDCSEIVVVARRQTQGKGRGGNDWLSPDGCAMFSFPLSLRSESNLGRSPSWVQHLAVLAMVEGVVNIPGYEDLDVRIKWPNDVYIGQEKTKIGGLIVQSIVSNHEIHCIVGCGVNVSNSVPTRCLNDLIAKHNRIHGTQLAPLGVDQVIARTISHMEKLVQQFQHSGWESVAKIYLNRWMHTDAEVTVEGGGIAKILGVDDYGFLKVKLENGQETSFQPDGNSFDLMKNLISVKR